MALPDGGAGIYARNPQATESKGENVSEPDRYVFYCRRCNTLPAIRRRIVMHNMDGTGKIHFEDVVVLCKKCHEEVKQTLSTIGEPKEKTCDEKI